MAVSLYLSAVTLLIIYGVGLVVYRLFFHPLASFPGPKLAAATQWYEAYFDLFKKPGGQYMHELNRMHSVYGPIVRVSPHELHVKDPDWLDVLYVGPTKGLRDRYTPAAQLVGTPEGIFGTVPHALHRKRRSAWNALYSKAAIASQQAIIYDKLDLLCKGLREQLDDGKIIEMRPKFLAFAADVVCQYALDYSMDLLKDNQRADEWQRTARATADTTSVARQFTWSVPMAMKLPVGLMRFLNPDMARVVAFHRRVQRLAGIAIQEYETPRMQEKPKSQTTMFESFLKNEDLPASEKRRDRIAQEGFLAMAAGGETTGRVLASALFFVLAGKSSILSRLREELASVVKAPNSRPDWSLLEQLPYLTAVIKESLRLSQLIIGRIPLVAPQEKLRYGDWEIPAGTAVSMSLQDLHVDESIFPEPFEFRPERWLNDNPDLERISRYLVPFSRGSRMCIGINLAYAELYLCLARVFHDFDLELVDTTYERDIKVVRDAFVGYESKESKGVRIRRASKV